MSWDEWIGRSLSTDLSSVLVQREMESCRSPLATIQPFSAGQFGRERRCSGGEWTKAGAEAATGFNKEIRLPDPGSQRRLGVEKKQRKAINAASVLAAVLLARCAF
jgi:hypothetical protein